MYLYTLRKKHKLFEGSHSQQNKYKKKNLA